jgi:flagellar hook-associated protein 3 FlgL
VLAANADDAGLGAQLANIQSATNVLNAGVSATRNAANVLAQGQTIALQGAQSSNTPADLETLAKQVDGLIQQLLGDANAKSGDQYLFGGTASQTQPFAVTATNGQGLPQTITYQGSAQAATVEVTPGLSVPTLYAGSQVFQSGGQDAFQALIGLRDDLRNTKSLSSADEVKAISADVGKLQSAQQSVLQSTGAQSATLSQLSSMQTNVQSLQLAAQQLTSNLQGADVTQVVVQLQAQQNLLELTLEATSRMLQVGTSLLSFLH